MAQRAIAVVMLLAGLGLGWFATMTAAEPAVDADDATYWTRLTILIGLFAVALFLGAIVLLTRKRR